MTRLISVLVLGTSLFLAGCCGCAKEAGKTWGPGLMHWGDAPATAPTK